MSEQPKIYVAKRIITFNPDCETATFVVVKEGRILALGPSDEMNQWDFPVDDRFADKILMPGFVEAHGHAMTGECWRYCYLGFDQQRDPQGKLWPGVKTRKQALKRLSEAEKCLENPCTPLIAWHYDPIFWSSEENRIDRDSLDLVSKTRPILLMHASGHVMNINSKLLEMAHLHEQLDIPDLCRDQQGRLTGELRDLATQFAALRVVGNPLVGLVDLEILHQYARLACNAGVTTISELYASLDADSLHSYQQASAQDEFPARLYAAQNAETLSIEDGLARLKKAKAFNSDKLFLGSCKLIVDGSIQSFTARLAWPGYHCNVPNGQWKQPPNKMAEMILEYHRAGVQLHIHVNGDQATELVLDILESVLNQYPRIDHRHTLQHCQMANESQYRRMAKLGVCVNLFSNHLYYWGDQHAQLTVGPVRAARFNAAASALAHGVPLAIHSDTPVTPLQPLFSAWCASERQTRSGKVLGVAQKISPEQALRALTIGAAYTLGLDHQVGSIEVGKHADFAVLYQDPLPIHEDCRASAPSNKHCLKDIAVWGTVLGGVPFPSQRGVDDAS